ncbi:MAG: hypothetical protein A2Y25_07550 [Candidatus Melainabacteria bacterium GWF2_37_15]|nr:MAG: hypothetical protein A2Y25_07550 [Candidatus Melainabacteria bacterium GWF2_37_15]
MYPNYYNQLPVNWVGLNDTKALLKPPIYRKRNEGIPDQYYLGFSPTSQGNYTLLTPCMLTQSVSPVGETVVSNNTGEVFDRIM